MEDSEGGPAKLGDTKLHWADVLVIVGYFAIVLGVGLWSSKRSSKGSVSGYFLASRNMHWIPVGASLFASNIGSGHFVGLAGSGAASGIGISIFELHAVFVMIILGWLFVPVYMASGVYTMPEYLQKRFGGQRIRVYLSVLALIIYVFTKISADLFAGALFIEQSLGWNLYLSVTLLLAVAAIFTIGGGLSAVIWTDFVQTILMVIGSVILMAKSFVAVGGYDRVWESFLQARPTNATYNWLSNESCGVAPADSLHLIRAAGSNELPWTGVLFGLTVSSVWYWCSDQVIVQRALAAKNLSHGKAGTVLAAYLKLLPLYLLVFPGMIARVLYPEEVACAVPSECERVCGSPGGCTNIAYPLLVLRLMPTGLSGMMLAVMMAALMSSLTSIFNSSSTIFTMDIWTRIRKSPSDWELLIVGRLFVVLLVFISILWIPVIKASQGSQLFVYIQTITSYLSPPVCAVYVLAVLWGRINEKGAFWGLMIGLIIGLVRFGLEFGYSAPSCTSTELDTRPWIIVQAVGRLHFLHFGALLFVVTVVVATVISLASEPIDPKYLYRLTFWSRHSAEVRTEREIIPEVTSERPENGIAAQTKVVVDDYMMTSPKSVSGSIIPLATEEERDYVPCWKRVFHLLCGIEGSDASTTDSYGVTAPANVRPSPEEEAKMSVECLNEKPKWMWLLRANAVLLIAATSALIIYYA